LIVAVPDFQLYEHEVWPSKFNFEHKTAWSVEKLKGLLENLPAAELIYCRLMDTNFDYSSEMKDVEQSGTAEVIVEGVVRKNASINSTDA